jgi:hypothetical protein
MGFIKITRLFTSTFIFPMLLPKLEKDDNEEHEELLSISTISIS